MGVKMACGKVFGALALVFVLSGGAMAESEKQDPPHYKIGPSDILSVSVWKEKDLSQDTVLVLPDGRITLPLLDALMAAGRTADELKKTIADEYEKFVTKPEVTVIIKEIRSRRIYTIGKMSRPGPYALESDMTVLQALSIAGGFAQWADEKNIMIVRREGEKETQIPFNYKEYISGKNPGQNILLKPGDTIVVP
jgi:polysaccharide biosynthesis/export protein